MTYATLARDSAGHVEAYCSTGTSPGFSARLSQRIELDHQASRTLEVSHEVHGPENAPALVEPEGVSSLVREAVQVQEVIR
jgi:hypothetical protein